MCAFDHKGTTEYCERVQRRRVAVLATELRRLPLRVCRVAVTVVPPDSNTGVTDAG